MRLTAEVIQKASSYLNPVKEREIDLRACKVAVIENLGATKDQYDCIDLSDNELTRLENFPVLNRLRTILLNNNKISFIERGLGESLPNLETVVLTNNRINNLGDLDALADLPNLKRLSLLDNLVTKKQHYRLYVIHRLPKLALLDFSKVKKHERLAAAKLFGSEKGKKLEQELSKQVTKVEESKNCVRSCSTKGSTFYTCIQSCCWLLFSTVGRNQSSNPKCKVNGGSCTVGEGFGFWTDTGLTNEDGTLKLFAEQTPSS